MSIESLFFSILSSPRTFFFRNLVSVKRYVAFLNVVLPGGLGIFLRDFRFSSLLFLPHITHHTLHPTTWTLFRLTPSARAYDSPFITTLSFLLLMSALKMDRSIFEMLDNFESHARPHDNEHLTQNSRNSDTHGGYERFQSALNHHQYRLYQHELSHRERDSNTGQRHAYDYDNFDDDVTFDEFGK